MDLSLSIKALYLSASIQAAECVPQKKTGRQDAGPFAFLWSSRLRFGHGDACAVAVAIGIAVGARIVVVIGQTQTIHAEA